MSLSTLGSQLAALNAPGKNFGSSLPTSRRHEDAIGRGLSHSVQTGHSISKKFHLHKPSIIYEDSRKASDVPLVTIRENCVSSLRQLESLDPEFGPFVETLCKSTDQRERALLTNDENEKVDKLMESLLYRLALRMGGMSNNTKTTTASCLHVIEFLLRRYDMHLRPKTATAALLAMIPLHEEPYFLRLLQLIDLANLPAWSFLRPYAVPGAKLARQVISKQASSDTALLREICNLAQRNSKLPNHAQSLSFIAAVVVETLKLQEQKFGSMEERTCKTVLPYVVGACRESTNEGYQNWGHIIASAVVETGGLAEEPRQVLVTSILKGIVGSREVVISNGLLVALSTLAQPLDGVDPKSYQLSMIGSSTFFGYPMEKTIFQGLLNLEGLPSIFGQLYEDEGIEEFSHWIASILVVGWKNVFEKKKESKKIRRARDLLLELIKEPKLRSLWKKNSNKWVESFCSYAIMHANLDFQETNGSDEDFFKSVLQSLERIDGTAYGHGLANALIRSKKSERDVLAAWLGLKKFQSEQASSDDLNTNEIVLPPRVALEHADSNVRLDAIQTILQEEVDRENDSMEIEGETVLQALLRRFVDDDDCRVSIAAGKALYQLLEQGKEMDTKELGQGSLEAVYKWAESSTVDEKVRPTALIQALRIVAYVGTKAVATGTMPDLLVRLVECLGAYFDSSDTNIAKESARSLCTVFYGSKSKTKAKDINSAHLLLLSQEELLGRFRRNLGKTRKSEQAIRRLCMPTLMKAFVDSFAAGKKSKTLPHEAVEFCKWSVMSYAADLDEREQKLLSECLGYTAGHIVSSHSSLQNIIIQFSQCDGSTFSQVLLPFIRDTCDNVKDENGGDVSGMAVLMELILASSSSSSNLVIENLFLIAMDYCRDNDGKSEIFGFAPALVLLTHTNEGVRKKALDLLDCIGQSLLDNAESEWKSLGGISKFIAKNRSSALMGDSSFLAECLGAVASNAEDKAELHKCLLTLCVYAAAGFGSIKQKEASEMFKNGWLDPFQATGGHQVAVTILTALEQAGEDSFPLTSRWLFAGKPILESLLESNDQDKNVPPSLVNLVDVVLRMLKGIKITDSLPQSQSEANIIITTGPASRGGRARSYSFGKNDSISFLKPYPKDMHALIVSILSNDSSTQITREIQNSVFDTVLRSQSWMSGVFSALPKAVRSKIASSVLMIAIQDRVLSADEILFSLPLGPREVAELLKGQEKSESKLAAVSYLADYSSMNCQRLIHDGSIKDLFSALFKTLSSLSFSRTGEDDGEFSRQAVLSALLELSNATHENGQLNLDKERKFEDWIDLLVDLLGGNKPEVLLLNSIRSKRTTLGLLTSLCSMYPSKVTGKLIPSMRAILSNTSSQKEASISAECIALIVPVYLQHSESASQVDLFKAFIGITIKESDEKTRVKLYQGFLNSLSKTTSNEDDKWLVGAFLSSCLAGELYLNLQSEKPKNDASQVVAQILQYVSIQTRIVAVSTMLGYGKEIIINFLDEKSSMTTNDVISLEDLAMIAVHGPSCETKVDRSQNMQDVLISLSDKTIVKLCILLMVTVCDTVSSTPFRKCLRQIDSNSSGKILCFWQDLILIQTACHNFLGGSSEASMGGFWENINEITDDTLGELQNNLPAHIFLAFASSLIKEGGTDELRARAAQLIADRSASIESSNPEAELFRDMLPFLASLLCTQDESKLLLQSALVAIESIARSLCLVQDSKLNPVHVEQLSTAIVKSADLLETENHTLDDSASSFGRMSSAVLQVVCSAALCASTCIRACGPRSLVTLPKLMKPLTSFLCKANKFLSTEDIGEVEQGQAKLMQLSILRSLIAVTETLPQFLAPYLNDLFDPHALPSAYLRRDTDDQAISIKNISERLDEVLVSKVPARVLIPSVSNTVISNQHESTSLQALLSLLKSCTSSTKGSELAGHANTLLLVLTHVYESCDSIGEDESLSSACSELFLALILKLSEVQLRSLYTRLRDWRGDFEKSDPNKYSSRRIAFWSLSSALGKQLRSIYLPCLSSVFSDAVEELEAAVSQLCKRGDLKKAGGKKKQRLDIMNTSDYDMKSIDSLQSLLLCLEVSLRADAHNGGAWIREGDSQRFDLLLEPLGKLLQARVAVSSSSTITYQSLIQGDNTESGSVVDCIVALASAAGDEQLWKPLNHSILQACGNEGRSEVRKAGVMCLASLIKSIGEEYMVLVPECLPVLSELLEDSDEEILGLAQECISLSEEFLGESLQDSLR